MLHPAVSFENNLVLKDWLGQIKNEDLGEWVDGMLLLVFGGIPWQVISKTSEHEIQISI